MKKHLQLENASYELKFGIANMKKISVYLGHNSVIITEIVYVKYSPDFGDLS